MLRSPMGYVYVYRSFLRIRLRCDWVKTVLRISQGVLCRVMVSGELYSGNSRLSRNILSSACKLVPMLIQASKKQQRRGSIMVQPSFFVSFRSRLTC